MVVCTAASLVPSILSQAQLRSAEVFAVGHGALLVGVKSSCSCVPHPLRVVTCRVWFELTKKLLFSTHEPPLTARFLRWWFGGMGLVGPIKSQTASSVPTRQTSGFMRKFSDASHGTRCYLTT